VAAHIKEELANNGNGKLDNYWNLELQRSEIYATKSEFDHICVFPSERLCAIDV